VLESELRPLPAALLPRLESVVERPVEFSESDELELLLDGDWLELDNVSVLEAAPCAP
jgi:hypothetical protein